MTSKPDASPVPELASNDNPGASSEGGLLDGSNPGQPTQRPNVEPGMSEPSDQNLVDQAGRPLGPRALLTRRNILEATVVLLSEKPMRDMRVIDIARRIGSSPATFYQYFKDVEDVVLHLAIQMKESTPELVVMIDGDWTGREGHERGRQISNMVIDHWEKYAPVLRARNNASDEGHKQLREARMGALLPLVDAFREAIVRAQSKDEPSSESDGGWTGGRVDPLVGATALSSCLERLSMYHGWIEDLGGSREELVETTATLLQGILTSRR